MIAEFCVFALVFSLMQHNHPRALYASRMLHVQKSRKQKRTNHKEDKEAKQNEEEQQHQHVEEKE